MNCASSYDDQISQWFLRHVWNSCFRQLVRLNPRGLINLISLGSAGGGGGISVIQAWRCKYILFFYSTVYGLKAILDSIFSIYRRITASNLPGHTHSSGFRYTDNRSVHIHDTIHLIYLEIHALNLASRYKQETFIRVVL